MDPLGLRGAALCRINIEAGRVRRPERDPGEGARREVNGAVIVEPELCTEVALRVPEHCVDAILRQRRARRNSPQNPSPFVTKSRRVSPCELRLPDPLGPPPMLEPNFAAEHIMAGVTATCSSESG